MLKQTNLEAVKAVALQFLDHPMKKRDERNIPNHPFSWHGLYTFEGNEVILEEGTPAFDTWKAEQKKRIENAETVGDVLCLLELSWHIKFLLVIEPNLSGEAFCALLMNNYRLMWDPNIEAVSLDDLVECFKRCDPAILMDTDERKFYDALPDKVYLYRGVSLDDGRIEASDALSWTEDQFSATEFIRKNYDNADIYSAAIEKKHILACLCGRNSHYDDVEYVVDPQHLKEVEFVERYSRENEDEDEEFDD